mgnify:CR=1 FL=1
MDWGGKEGWGWWSFHRISKCHWYAEVKFEVETKLFDLFRGAEAGWGQDGGRQENGGGKVCSAVNQRGGAAFEQRRRGRVWPFHHRVTFHLMTGVTSRHLWTLWIIILYIRPNLFIELNMKMGHNYNVHLTYKLTNIYRNKTCIFLPVYTIFFLFGGYSGCVACVWNETGNLIFSRHLLIRPVFEFLSAEKTMFSFDTREKYN